MAPNTASLGNNNSAVAMFDFNIIHGVFLHEVYISHNTESSLAMAVELLFPKLAVFGASGPMGRLVVQQALAKGHVVCAIVRSPEKFDLK